MTIASMTYNDLAINTVANWINTNCTNITNFAGIPACFKSGYSNKAQFAGSGASLCYRTITISGNAVPQVATSTVISEITSFMSARGIANLAATIPASEFLDFLKDMISFVCTKCTWTASQHDSHKYLVYWSGNGTFNNLFPLNDTQTKKLAIATDIVNLSENFINIVRENMRNKVIKYTYTFSAT